MTNNGRRKTKSICAIMRAKGITLSEAFVEIDLHNKVKELKSQTTDDKILELQLEFFDVISNVSKKIATGDYKSFLLTGSGGVGKTYGITKSLEQSGVNYIEAGELSPTHLYVKLYENRQANTVLLFDDADGIFYNKTSLGFLKKALDSGAKKRMIAYGGKILKTSKGEIVPTSFEYKGTIIFISNINIYNQSRKSNEIATHLQAIMSRSRYIDLYEIFNSERDYLVRIDYLKDTIFENRNVDLVGKKVISDFINNNYAKFRELGVRAVDLLCETWLTCNGNEKEFTKESLITFTSLHKA